MMQQMRLGLTGILVSFTVCAAIAQQAKPSTFREESFDFGTISEDGGPVTHEFVFTNTTTRPVKIVSVQASCGCTTPAWSKDPIPAGQTGFVQASFNPKGRPGTFNKTLTVTTDMDGGPVILVIKGQVESLGKAPIESDYQVANGNWKLRTGSFNLGKVYTKDEYAVHEFPFVNSGQKPVAMVGKPVSPAYIRVEVVPATVAPGGRGVVKVGYNGKMRGQYGFQVDNVEIMTDDEQNPTKSFVVRATIEDYFAPLTAEEQARAPRLTVSTSVDLGRIRQNGEATREIPIANTGKKELQIKALQGNCNCLAISAAKTTLKPGETTQMRVTFKPEDRVGSHNKAVTIYSNDPVSPVQRITLAAYVQD
jgi:hypothetical protein